MRSIRELYSINGVNGTFTKEYLEAHNVQLEPRHCLYNEGYARHLIAKNSQSGKFYITQADGTKQVAYLYGQYTWSYSEVERDRYRAEQTKARENLIARNKLLKQIMAYYENMNNEELREIVDQMDREV